MKLKGIAAVALSMVTALGVTGCGSTSTGNAGSTPAATEAVSEGASTSDSTSTSNGDTIKVGFIGPKTGSVAQYGTAAANGIELAVKEVNANGGISGKQIELISYDNKGDASESINLFNRLVDNDGVSALLGPVISSNGLAIAPLADEKGLPMITPTGTNSDITVDSDYVFRGCYTDPYQGSIMAKFASENLTAKKAAILYNTGDDYSLGLAEAFKETFEEAGGEIVSYEGYTNDDKDFKAVLSNIKETSPEVLFLPDYYNMVGLIAGQVKEVGLETTLLGGDGWDGVQENYGEATEGSYFANHYCVDDTDEVVANFVNNYKDTYNGEVPNAFAALGYDSAKILFAAIEKAGSTDSQAVVDALKGTDLDCVTGHVVFDENGDPQKSVTILKMQGGKSVLETKIQ